MGPMLRTALFALIVGFILAQFVVLLYNEWYFADARWLKIGLLALPAAALMHWLLHTRWWRFWTWTSAYWTAIYLIAAFSGRSFDLTALSFTSALNYEAAFVWVPAVAAWAIVLAESRRRHREQVLSRRDSRAVLALRRHLRESAQADEPGNIVAPVLAAALCLLAFQPLHAAENTGPVTGAAQLAPDAPARPFPDRHLEMVDPAKRIIPPQPELPGMYPTPAHLRAREVFYILVENKVDGAISVVGADGQSQPAGKVLAPVKQVNPNGFTASGWGENCCVCATAVNAIHLKTTHNYETGKGTVFSLVPVEFATFDPGAYKSYFNDSSTLFTDIKAGTGIFGSQWAPLIGSRIYKLPATGAPAVEPADATDMPEGLAWGPEVGATAAVDAEALPAAFAGFERVAETYVPAEGDTLLIRVERLRYNPEYLEFENRFGGIIWVKELLTDPYPIGQVLKPVAGVGRFTGTQYADIGRIRANHPGVIDISTSKYGVIGGFQIIPRDHSMSPEMTNARVKTQWMVVGPLWALDPSWEGLPPLFTDYIYPSWVPSFDERGKPTTEVSGADVYLSRFTVKARYSDEADPNAWVTLREAEGLRNDAFATLTHIRIYFPRDSEL